jgi:hypothetical protein
VGAEASRAVLDRLYAAVARVAERASERPGLSLGIALPMVVLALVAINRWVLLGFANSGDEHAYLYQASTLAAGRLWNAAPPFTDAFTLNYIVFDGPRAFSSFPVGWPLVIAAVMTAGLPASLINPILGAATIVLTSMLGARLYSPRVGVLAAALVGVSPFFLFNGASYFSHTFCSVLLLGAAYLASREDRTPAWVPLGVGFLVGWAILARYLTGVACAIPILLWLLRPDGSPGRTGRREPVWRQLMFVALGGLPWVAVLAWYNFMFTGNPWQLTTLPLTRGLWFKSGWYYRGLDIISTHLQRYATWTPPVLVALYVYYLTKAPRELRRGWLDWLPVCMVLALYAYVERGGNQYGPRFHYEVFPFLVIFVAGNVFRTSVLDGAPGRQRWSFALLALSVAVMPLTFAVHAARERHVIEERMDPYRTAERAGLQNAVMFMSGRVGTSRSIAAEDLTRHGIDTSGPVVYALDTSPAANCQVAAGLGRTPYVYGWDWERATSVLTRLSCGPRP